MKKKWQFSAEYFGPFLAYIVDENITDITWNGTSLWIDDLTCGRYKVTDEEILKDIDTTFVESFSSRVANYAGVNFNSYHPLLEAQIDLLRISIVHEAYAHTGTTIAIRRTSDKCRLIKEDCLENGFCTEDIWDLMPKIVKSGFSCIAGGLPGVGKTELLKLLSTAIPPQERAIVMEDSPEFHFSKINPENDCTEWRIDDTFDYEMAIKASLRQRPEWNILAEARGRETQYLMENFSTGIKVLTSTHLENEIDLIPRLENMIGDSNAATRIKNEIYLRGLVVFVLNRRITDKGIFRQLRQICFYSKENGENTRTLIVDGGKVVNRKLPPNVLKKFQLAGFDDPFAPVEKTELVADETVTVIEEPAAVAAACAQ